MANTLLNQLIIASETLGLMKECGTGHMLEEARDDYTKAYDAYIESLTPTLKDLDPKYGIPPHNEFEPVPDILRDGTIERLAKHDIDTQHKFMKAVSIMNREIEDAAQMEYDLKVLEKD